MTHELKCWPEFFSAVQNWDKLFEIRRNDRSFKVGDIVWLREFIPESGEYTGASARRTITYMTDFPPGLRDGYVCMGLGGIDIYSRERERTNADQSADPRRAPKEEEAG